MPFWHETGLEGLLCTAAGTQAPHKPRIQRQACSHAACPCFVPPFLDLAVPAAPPVSARALSEVGMLPSAPGSSPCSDVESSKGSSSASLSAPPSNCFLPARCSCLSVTSKCQAGAGQLGRGAWRCADSSSSLPSPWHSRIQSSAMRPAPAGDACSRCHPCVGPLQVPVLVGAAMGITHQWLPAAAAGPHTWGHSAPHTHAQHPPPVPVSCHLLLHTAPLPAHRSPLKRAIGALASTVTEGIRVWQECPGMSARGPFVAQEGGVGCMLGI
jgi:hypothetical protein